MKFVILGNTKLGYSWFVLTHRQGIKLNGHELWEIDYKSTPLNNIASVLKSIKADFVFTHLTFHTSVHPTDRVLQMYRDVNRAVGTKFIHTLNDARTVDRYMDNVSDAIHCAFVGNTDCIDSCRDAWKIPVFFSPYSSLTYDSIAKRAPDLSFKDAVFTGSVGAHGDRSSFIKKLQERMPIKIFQTQSGNDLRKRTPELSISANNILGLCTGYDIDHYIDVRPFQYMGCGAVMTTRVFMNMDDIIPYHLFYPFYGYSDEDADEVKSIHYNFCQSDNMKLREKAFKFIQDHHSCKVRIGDCIDVLTGKRDRVRSFIWDW